MSSAPYYCVDVLSEICKEIALVECNASSDTAPFCSQGGIANAETLLSVALVCRGWALPALDKLWKTVSIKTNSHVAYITRILEHRPIYRNFILTIDTLTSIEPIEVSLISKLIRLTPRIQELTILNLEPPSSFFGSLHRLAPNLKVLNATSSKLRFAHIEKYYKRPDVRGANFLTKVRQVYVSDSEGEIFDSIEPKISPGLSSYLANKKVLYFDSEIAKFNLSETQSNYILKKLVNLVELRLLSPCNFSQSILESSLSQTCRILDFSQNLDTFDDEFLNLISNASNLEQLYIPSHCNFTDIGLEEFSSSRAVSRLQTFHIVKNKKRYRAPNYTTDGLGVLLDNMISLKSLKLQLYSDLVSSRIFLGIFGSNRLPLLHHLTLSGSVVDTGLLILLSQMKMSRLTHFDIEGSISNVNQVVPAVGRNLTFLRIAATVPGSNNDRSHLSPVELIKYSSRLSRDDSLLLLLASYAPFLRTLSIQDMSQNYSAMGISLLMVKCPHLSALHLETSSKLAPIELDAMLRVGRRKGSMGNCLRYLAILPQKSIPDAKEADYYTKLAQEKFVNLKKLRI